jgi:hypothetical protein
MGEKQMLVGILDTRLGLMVRGQRKTPSFFKGRENPAGKHLVFGIFI